MPTLAPLVLLQLTSADAGAATLPDRTRFETLDNGLQVIVVPLDTPDLVALQTWMDVGARNEVEAGTTGFAHFFEHLMFHGSEQLRGEERERQLMDLGAEENAWTGQDDTCYHMKARADRLDELLRIESDRFLGLFLVEDELRREAGAVQGEWRQGLSDPGERLYEELWATAYRTHTYHHSVIGLPEDVAAMPDGHEHAKRFFSTFYRPDRATIVIAGDVDPAAAVELVKKHYADWTPAADAPPALAIPAEPEQTEPRSGHIVWDQGPTNARLAVGWKVPPSTPGTTEWAALQVANELLASKVAPLYRALIEDKELAWDLWAPQWGSVDPGLFEIYVDLRDAGSLDAAQAEVLGAVASLATASDDDVAAARDHVWRRSVLQLDSPESWATAVGSAARYGGGPQALDADLDALAALTPDELRRVAGTWLVDPHRTIVTLVQAPTVEDGGTRDKGGEVDR